MVTIPEIKKGVEREYSRLSPEEWAAYQQQESYRLAAVESAGGDPTEGWNELETLYNTYVLPMGWPEYARFWRAMYREVKNVGMRYILTKVVPAMIREHALFGLLIIGAQRERKRAKNTTGPKWTQLNERTRVFQERYQALAKEIRELLASDAWEKMGIDRPDFIDLDLSGDIYARDTSLEMPPRGRTDWRCPMDNAE